MEQESQLSGPNRQRGQRKGNVRIEPRGKRKGKEWFWTAQGKRESDV